MPLMNSLRRLSNAALGNRAPSPEDTPDPRRSSTSSEMMAGARGLNDGSGHLAARIGIDASVVAKEEESSVVQKALQEGGVKEQDSRMKRKFQERQKWLQFEMRRHQELVDAGFDKYQGRVIYHPFPRLRKIVVHSAFETIMAVLITANCVIIGWQAELRNPEGTTLVINTVIEHLFTSLFLMELVLRAIVFNWTFWLNNENHLDIFLVVLSVLNSWILGPAGVKADFLRKATVLRILRLVRIAKSFRRQFKEMWQLLQGIVDSFETLLWTYVMMNVVLYFFAILATVLFAKMELFDDDEDSMVIIEENFSDVLQSMLTLFQIMTLDSWSDIMRPMMAAHTWVAIFFIVFITVSVFLLMNLITSVIVTQAFENGKADQAEKAKDLEDQKEQTVKELKQMFQDMDTDGGGTLSRDEIAKAWRNRRVRQKFRTMDIGKKDLNILWSALDDGDGELTIEEFTGGMRKLKGEARAKDILKLYKQVRILESSIREITILSDYSKDRMNNIKMKLRTTFRELDATRRTLGRIKETARLASRSQPLCV